MEEFRLQCRKCKATYRSGFSHCPRDGATLEIGASDFLIGQVIANRWLVRDLVGRGRLGSVYRGQAVDERDEVAIKVFFGELAIDQKAVLRLSRAEQRARGIQHPSAMTARDCGLNAGLLFSVTDLAKGPSLAAVISEIGPLASPRCASLCLQMAECLEEAHGRGLVHGDFKSQNLFVEGEAGDELIRVSDFGTHTLLDRDELDGQLTGGLSVGTPGYLAPERILGLEADSRSDLYSLGVVLYEMLAGARPFAPANGSEAAQHLQSAPPPVSLRSPGVAADRELERLALWLLEKRPDARPVGAGEVVSVLHRWHRKRSSTAYRVKRPAVRVMRPATRPDSARGRVVVMRPLGADEVVTRPSRVRSNPTGTTPSGTRRPPTDPGGESK